jgi:hypothetical protein
VSDLVTPFAANDSYGNPGSVSQGDTVDPLWGNAVTTHITRIYPDAATRDAQWVTPPRGALCVTTDTDTLWQRTGSGNGVWSPVPFGRYGTILSPWKCAGGTITPGVGGINYGRFTRFGRFVMYETALWTVAGFSVPGSTNGNVTVTLPFLPSAADYNGPAIMGRSGAFETTLPALPSGFLVVANLNQATPTKDVGFAMTYLNAATSVAISPILWQHINAQGTVISGQIWFTTDDA